MRETLEKQEIRESLVVENKNQHIFGILHRPALLENPPIVVVLHGFASSKHGANRCYVTLAEQLAKVGIATLRFDFRGSGDSEGSLADITLEDLVSDAITVINHLDSIETINKTRVALFGASLGGTIGVLAAARTKKIKAMALWAPVASGELWYRDFLKQHPEYIHVDPSKILSNYKGTKLHPEFREQFACLMAHKILPQLNPLPILHMHGEKDDIVSIAHQNAYQQMCDSESSTVQFLKYPDGEHSLGFSVNFPGVLEESVRWFQRHL